MSENQLDLEFTRDVVSTPTRTIAGMVRGNDGLESQHAAVALTDKLSAIQNTILTLIKTCGPLNAKQLESQPAFRGCGPSTVRKRISELKALGKVHQVGRRDGCAVWGLVP